MDTENCMLRLSPCLAIWVWAAVCLNAQTEARSNSTLSVQFSKTVGQIDAGTLLPLDQADQSTQNRWNHTILLAKPRIASGDIDALSESIRQAASTFVLSIAATVDIAAEAPQPKYRLAEVGVGYSIVVGGQYRIVRSETYAQQGVSLSFLQRQVLSENEKQFSQIRTVARGSSLLMFDVPAILLRGNQHRDFTMRHLVWIDSATGKLATMIWLIQVDSKKQPLVATSEPIRWLEAETREDRAIHVDGNEFTLSIPSKRAFALENLPPGRAIAWNDAAVKYGAQTKYDMESMQALLHALNEANVSAQKSSK